jgi:16S rRNA (guanine966-N2)-methyltransferase
MRLSGGRFCGRVLKTPKGDATRPTSGIVRETLFNILAAEMPGARVLDLFAGSGSVGLEALGRGAARAVLVEHARPALACLKDNIAALGVAGDVTVMPVPVARALDALARQGEPFDLIFLDPPFADAAAYQQVLDAIAASTLLAEEGVVVAQHDRRLTLPEQVGTLTRARLKPIGDNALSFYRREYTR